MGRVRWSGLAVSLVPLLGACGGKALALAHTTDAGDASPGPPSPLVAGCPSSAPAEASACGVEGLKCEYGDDPSWMCNTIAYCYRGTWGVSVPQSGCPSQSFTPDQDCPPSHAAAEQMTVCSLAGKVCAFPEGICACIDQTGPPWPDASTLLLWLCATLNPGCPSTQPRIGSACAEGDLECDYGVCGVPPGRNFRCDGTTGAWTDGSPVNLCSGG